MKWTALNKTQKVLKYRLFSSIQDLTPAEYLKINEECHTLFLTLCKMELLVHLSPERLLILEHNIYIFWKTTIIVLDLSCMLETVRSTPPEPF